MGGTTLMYRKLVKHVSIFQVIFAEHKGNSGKHLLSTYCVLSTMLGVRPRTTEMNKDPCPHILRKLAAIQ